MNKHTAQLLEQHFDTAFAAPNGIAKLRELILTLAMQGKLVEQVPNDPPASELLKEIEAEKQRLVKTEKIKKPKSLPTVDQLDAAFVLPQSWTWTRLGTIGNIFNGNSINAREKETKYVGANGLPYIATKDVGYGLDALDYENGIYIPESEEKFKIAHQGAVLICAEGGSAGKKCGITGRDICFGNKLFANELFGGVPSKFILYLYLSPVFKESFNAAMTGIIGGVSIAKFLELLVPLPPLKEQRRIVARIDQLMARCDELEKLRKERAEKRLAVHAVAVKQLLDIPDGSTWAFIQQHFGELYTVKENVAELRKAILQLAVMGRLSEQNTNDEPISAFLTNIYAERQRLKIKKTTDLVNSPKPLGYEIPEQWKWVYLDDVLIFGPTNGFSPRAVDYETNTRSLTLSATTSGTFKGEYSKFIDVDISNDSDLWLHDGDILVQRGNTIEYVGVPAVYRGNPGVYVYPDLMMKLRVSSHMNTDYVYYAMSSVPAREYLRAHASGTSGTMPKINQKTLKSLPIPVPPLEEQHRIVARIDQLMALCDTLEQQIDAATVKQSELLTALLNAQPQQHTDIIDLSTYRSAIGCYVVGKLANTQYFGRTVAAKVMYLAQAHMGLTMDFHPEREAAGPLDKWIYDFERRGQRQGWFEVNEKTLASGRKKTEYRCLSALSEPSAKAEALMSAEQQAEFDRLIYALADKKTEEVEIIATLFAAWNDFLIDGTQPTDEQIITDVRENWHERKARFSPSDLKPWLAWLRKENFVPRGLPPRTVQQQRLGV